MAVPLNPTGTPAQPLGDFGELPTAMAAAPVPAAAPPSQIPAWQQRFGVPPGAGQFLGGALGAFKLPFTGEGGSDGQFAHRQPVTGMRPGQDGGDAGSGGGPIAAPIMRVNPGTPMIPGGDVTPPPGSARPL
jgi:hypothetical protein